MGGSNVFLAVETHRIDIHQSASILRVDRLENQIGSIDCRLDRHRTLVPAIPIAVDVDAHLADIDGKFMAAFVRAVKPSIP